MNPEEIHADSLVMACQAEGDVMIWQIPKHCIDIGTRTVEDVLVTFEPENLKLSPIPESITKLILGTNGERLVLGALWLLKENSECFASLSCDRVFLEYLEQNMEHVYRTIWKAATLDV